MYRPAWWGDLEAKEWRWKEGTHSHQIQQASSWERIWGTFGYRLYKDAGAPTNEYSPKFTSVIQQTVHFKIQNFRHHSKLSDKFEEKYCLNRSRSNGIKRIVMAEHPYITHTLWYCWLKQANKILYKESLANQCSWLPYRYHAMVFQFLGGPPPHIPIGLKWDSSPGTMFKRLVKIIFMGSQ